MLVIVNGKNLEVDENTTISMLLDKLDNTSKMIVVERNLKIVQKDEYSSTLLSSGDSIEIVSFAGGG